MNTDAQLRSQVALFMKRLYDKGLTTCSGGNISVLNENKELLITSSGKDKGNLLPEDIGKCTLEGENKSPELRLSMETAMHTSVYKARSDVKAVIHAHPVYATSFAATESEIDTRLSGEMRALLGKIGIAEYACMGSNLLANNVASAISGSNVVLLKNHGVIAVGKTLFEAYDRIEVLETAAKMTFITRLLGNTKALSEKQLEEIDRFFENYLKGKS